MLSTLGLAVLRNVRDDSKGESRLDFFTTGPDVFRSEDLRSLAWLAGLNGRLWQEAPKDVQYCTDCAEILLSNSKANPCFGKGTAYLMEELRMDSMSSSTGVDSLRAGGSAFRSDTGRSGGRDRMKSRIMSRASPRT